MTNSEGFVRSIDFFSKEVFSKDVSNYKVVRKGQFAYNPSRINVGSIDYLCFVDKVLVSPLYVVFETDSKIDENYLLRYMKTDWGNAQIRANTEGAVRDSLKYKRLENIKIPLPPLDGQKRIAHLLDKVEGLITQRKQHLKQLDDLLKSVFLEMFGDPVRNEKGWGSVTIGEILKVASGKALFAKDMDSDGPHKVYGGNGINGTHSKYMFEEPTLVIGRVGYYCGAVYITEPKSWVTDNALYVKDYLLVTNLIYLSYLLTAIDLNKYAGRAAQPLISGNRIYPIKTIDVPIELQNQFAVIVGKVEGIRSRYQKSLADLEVLYGALSHKAFKGELDLSRVPLPIENATKEMDATEEMTHEKHETEKSVELPAPEDLALLKSAEDRAVLLEKWAAVWLAHLDGDPFVVQAFMEVARQRLDELTEEAPDWGVTEYDAIKTWMFEALKQGHLVQNYDNAKNSVTITAPKG